MVAASQVTLNWNEIDRSILSAIDIMQTAQARLKSHSSWLANHVTASESLAGQSRLRGSLVSSCVADAEQLLQISRVQLMIARSVSSGVTYLSSGDVTMLQVAADENTCSDKLIARMNGKNSTLFQDPKRKITIRIKQTMQGIRGMVPAFAASNAYRRTVYGAKVFQRNLQSYIRSAIGHGNRVGRRLSNAQRTHLIVNNAAKPNGVSKVARVMASMSAFAKPSTALVAALSLAGALTVWTAAASMNSVLGVRSLPASGASAPAPAVLPQRPTPLARSCSVQAWGKSCYSQRSRL